MRRINPLTFLAVLALAFSMFTSISHAQTALEKAFVAKPKLDSAIWKKHDPASTLEVDHSAWDGFLSKYVKRNGSGVNLLAYNRVSAGDKKVLADYLALLQSTDVTKLNRNEQYAFWMNLYNASVVNVVLKNKGISSILKVKSNPVDFKGPFNDPVASVNGRTLTPDTIESGIVRPIWNDPNLHYGFNCAAISCPNLQPKAFRGKTVHAQLDAAARAFINDKRGVQVSNGKITASKIYFWYSDDFGGEKGVLKHLNKYANDNLKSQLGGKSKINAYEYDWSLNTAGGGSSG